MYPLILVALVILFFLPRYWLLATLAILSTALSGLALYDAWSGAQALHGANGEAPLADALFWQSRSWSEALIRQVVFVAAGAMLVAFRKSSAAGRARPPADAAATTSDAATTGPQTAGEDVAPQMRQTASRAPVAEASDSNAAPAQPDLSRGFRRVFVVLSIAWWAGALSLTLPRTIEDFPKRSAVELALRHECERELADDRDYQAWRNAEPVMSQAIESRARWDQWALRNPCHARVLSPAVKQEIDITHRADVTDWTKGLLLLLALIAVTPFAAAGVTFAAWRTYRWVGDGFKPGS